MTMLRACGFEWGSIKEFDASSGGIINTTYVRTGTYSGLTGNDSKFQLHYSPAAEIYTQAAVHFWSYGTASTYPFLYLLGADRSERVISLSLPSSTGYINVYTGDGYSGGTLVAAGTLALSAGAAAPFYILEIHAKIDSVSGFIEVRVDGLTYCTYYGNTKPGAATTFGSYNPYSSPGSSNPYCYWDDIVINDTSGIRNNSWGDGARIQLLKPNAVGSSSQWSVVPPGMTHNLAVDEFAPTGTEYLWSNTSGAVELLALDNQPVNLGNIQAVIPGVVAQRIAGATTSTLQLAVKTPTSTSLGVQKEVALSWTYYSDILNIDPTTGLPWRVYDIDSIESGVKIL